MDELRALDPLQLDREVRFTFRELTKARRRLRRGEIEDTPNPFFRRRQISSKSSVDELKSLSQDPLFNGLREWIGALTIARVTYEDEVRLASAWSRPDHRSPIDESPMSLRDLRAIVLAKAHDDGQREVLFRTLLGGGGEAASAARRLGERSLEAIRLLGDAPKTGSSAVADIAKRVVERIGKRTDVGITSSPLELVERASGRDAGEGWPARLNHHFVTAVFAGDFLWRGVAMGQVDFPPPISSASFALALARVGEEIALANLPTSQPFAMARSPRSLLAGARGMLFGALPAEPAFSRRVLGLGHGAARDQARKLGRMLLANLLMEALRAHCSTLIADPPSRAASSYEEFTELAFGGPWPHEARQVLPCPRPEDSGRIRALLQAATDRADLRDRFDEDWFQNPQAQEHLRHQHETPEERGGEWSLERTDAAFSALEGWIEDLSG